MPRARGYMQLHGVFVTLSPSLLCAGSHKGELRVPLDVRRMEADIGVVQQIPMRAGSGLVFTVPFLRKRINPHEPF